MIALFVATLIVVFLLVLGSFRVGRIFGEGQICSYKHCLKPGHIYRVIAQPELIIKGFYKYYYVVSDVYGRLNDYFGISVDIPLPKRFAITDKFEIVEVTNAE